MLEIALNNDVSKKRADDDKEKVLHLSSVNDHRVLLYSVDPSLNYQKRDTDVVNALECEGDKQADESVSKENADNVKVENIIQRDSEKDIPSPSESEEQALSPTSYSMNLCFSHNSPKTLNSDEGNAKVANAQGKADENTVTVSGATYKCRGKLRGDRRRGQGSWKFGGNRRQKGSKGKPPRSELSEEKLFKLREKERIAQKIRRLKRAEEKRSELLNGNEKRAVSGKCSEMANDGSVNDLQTVEDIRGNCSMPEPETTVNSVCLEDLSTSFPSVSQPVNDEKTLKARPSNSKLNYMFALGLQHNMKTEDILQRIDSCREFRTNSQNGPLVRILSQPMSDLEDRALENGISPKQDENMIANGANGCDNLNQSWSEESSDSCEKANPSANSPKKARRDNLSKEELHKLREKERMAKRKQRAKNRKVCPGEDPIATQSDESNSAIEEAESPKRQLLPQNTNFSNSCNNSNDSTSQTKNESSSSDCGRGNSLEKDDSSLLGERTDLPTKSVEGKKVKFGRFYDRSLLTAEELESLRRREREYQRKRRARLREEKFKALGEMQQNKISSEKDPKSARPNEVENFNEDSSRKYETRMSKGISRPSLRFLEHSSVSYFENEHDGRKLIEFRGEPSMSGKQERDCPENQASYSPRSELPIMYHKEFGPKECSLSQNDLETPLKVNEYGDYGNYINAEREDRIESEENCSVPVPESNQVQNNSSSEDREEDKAISGNGIEEHCILNDPNLEYQVTNENSIDREMYKTISAKRSSPLTEALYASDYKILQENGYHSMKVEPGYDTRFYELPGNSRIYHSSLVGHCPPSSQMIKCIEKAKKGDVSKERMFNVNAKEENFEASVDIRPCKRGVKTDTDSSSSQKWRNWKSGLTDSQLQRRRQSNREAQRRRRMRLRLMQMKSFQEQDQISFDEIMYKRFTPNKRMMVNEAIKAFNASKSKLKNMLERRQKVFMDAQIEKYKNEIDCNSPQNAAADVARKNRGCRIKVTPKRQVVVPSMGFPCSRGIVNEQLCDPGDNVCFPQHQMSPSYEPARLGQMDYSSIEYRGKSEKHFTPCLEDLSPPSYDDHLQNTSTRKRKQFCPRRLLSEAERRSHEGIQSVVIAQS